LVFLPDQRELGTQPRLKIIEDRPAAVLADGMSFLGAAAADVVLDCVELCDAFERLAGDRRGSNTGSPVLRFSTQRSHTVSVRCAVAEDVPLIVEHCEAVAAGVDVTRRWLGEQERRGLSFSFDVLAERLGVLEVACKP
jgi:hypothetical protein